MERRSILSKKTKIFSFACAAFLSLCVLGFLFWQYAAFPYAAQDEAVLSDFRQRQASAWASSEPVNQLEFGNFVVLSYKKTAAGYPLIILKKSWLFPRYKIADELLLEAEATVPLLKDGIYLYLLSRQGEQIRFEGKEVDSRVYSGAIIFLLTFTAVQLRAYYQRRSVKEELS